MPTYQYACTECGEQLEVVQKFTDDPMTVCPVCQGKLRKLFSSVGIVFKGSGFYRTDSRSSGSDATVPAGDSSKSDAAKTDKPAAASSDSSSSSTPAAAPAATSTSTPAPSSGSSASSSTPKAAAS